MRVGLGRLVLVTLLVSPAISAAQKPTTPANFAITATDTNLLTGDTYDVTGTFSTAGPLKAGVTVTSWNITVGPHVFSNLDSPYSTARVFLLIPVVVTLGTNNYPRVEPPVCPAQPKMWRIQFFSAITRWFFTAYVPTGMLIAPGTQADLTRPQDCFTNGDQTYISLRMSGLDNPEENPYNPSSWDYSGETITYKCLLYMQTSGSAMCAGDQKQGNDAEGTVTQF